MPATSSSTCSGPRCVSSTTSRRCGLPSARATRRRISSSYRGLSWLVLVPGIEPSESVGACRTLDPGDPGRFAGAGKHRDDSCPMHGLARNMQLSPGEDRLVELGDARGASGEDLSELVDYSPRRGVDQAAVDADADHLPVAFRNGDEIHRIGLHDFGQRNAMEGCNLLWVGAKLRIAPRPQHHRRDAIARAGRIVVEKAQNVALAEPQADLLTELSQH